MSGFLLWLARWRMERAVRRRQRAFRALSVAQAEVRAAGDHYKATDAILAAVDRSTLRRPA